MEGELTVLSEQQARRFYDRLRAATSEWAAERGGAVGSGLVNLLLVAPDIFILLWRLLKRNEITLRRRLLLAFALSYFLSPIDLVPDWLLGPLGFADDLMLAVAVLRTALVEVPPEVLQTEWSGDASLIGVLSGVARLADSWLHRPMFRPLRKLINLLLR